MTEEKMGKEKILEEDLGVKELSSRSRYLNIMM